MQSNFIQALAYVLRAEGGYSNDPHDPGGAKMYGIIQTEYNAWREQHGLPVRSVALIGIDERNEIYKTEYWDKVNGDNLPAGLDYCVFDAAVNSGVGAGLRWYVETVVPGAPVADSINKYCDVRLQFLRELNTWPHFGAGWYSRVAFVRANSIAMANGEILHDVAWVQKALNDLGAQPPLAVDDDAGPQTEAAVKLFQAAHGLLQDGIAGPATVAAIEAALKARASA